MSDLLNDASLVFIPSGYKAGTAYSVIPTNGDGDLTFSRASEATRVNSSGLVEKVRTNLVDYSQEFDNAAWNKNNSVSSAPVVTANDTTAPDGTTTADKIVFSNGSGGAINGVYNYFPAFSGARTASVWLKSASGTPTIYITTQDDGVGGTYTTCVLSTEWQRFSVTFTTNAVSAQSMLIGYYPSSGTPSGPSTNLTIYAWGAQVEVSDFGPTAYIPTTSSAVSVGPYSNIPRLNYQNGGGGCPSLLLEAQRTNALTYSEQFDNANWTKNVSVTSNAIVSPDGYQNADKILESSSNVQQWIYQSPTMTGAQSATIYAKKGERNYIAMATAGLDPSYFNLDTGTIVSTASGATTSIESVGNGWYRCTVSSASIVGGTFFIVWISYDGVNRSYAGDSNKGVYIWGAQNEAGSYPSSYIPTLGTSVTRVADACYKTGISSLIGQTEGTIYYDGIFGTNNDEVYVFLQKSGSTGINDSIYLQRYSAGTSIYFNVYLGGSIQALIGGGSFAVGDRVKIAAAYKTNDFIIYINGTQISFDTSGTPPTCDNLQIGTYTGAPTTAIYMANKVKEFILFPTRLTNSQLAELTA